MNWLSSNLSVDGILWAVLSPTLYGLICIKANRASFLPVLIAAFAVGFLTSYVAYIVELSLAQEGLKVEGRHAWMGFAALVALPEETVNLAALIGLTHNQVARGRAALIIACFIGCGFAASENLVYLKRFGGDVIATRFLTATAFHVFNAILMARLLITKAVQEHAVRVALALLIPVLLHSSYDYLGSRLITNN